MEIALTRKEVVFKLSEWSVNPRLFNDVLLASASVSLTVQNPSHNVTKIIRQNYVLQ
jgi:hypothetical protein